MGEVRKYGDSYYNRSEELYNSIKPLLEKVIKELHNDIDKLKMFRGSNAILNAHCLDGAVGNHMCDDEPEWFGITKLDGHKIRGYFQSTGMEYPFRDYIVFLHRDFPELMQKEDEWYVESANKIRMQDGAKPINPKTYQIEQ